MSSEVADWADGRSKRLIRSARTGATRRALTAAEAAGPGLPALIGALGIAAVAIAAGAAPAPTLTVAVLSPAALVDARERRLPDRWVLAASVVLVAGTTAAWLAGHPPAVSSIAAGAVAMAGPLLALHLVSPEAMGFGDVKASAVLGAALGSVDWRLGLVALSMAAGSAAAVGLARRLHTIAFGPFLLGAAAVTLAAAAVMPTPVPIGAG